MYSLVGLGLSISHCIISCNDFLGMHLPRTIHPNEAMVPSSLMPLELYFCEKLFKVSGKKCELKNTFFKVYFHKGLGGGGELVKSKSNEKS